MFEAVAGGASCGAVARQLNRAGVRTMFGKRFKTSSVRRTVTNPVYIGTIVAGKKRRRGDVVFFRDVCEHVGLKGSCVSRLLAQAVLSGKVHNLGHQQGWIAAE